MFYKILLVDDDEDFLDELKECLDGFNIVCARSGKEALDKVRRPNLIDLVLLDVHLPDRKGIEVLKELKKISSGLKVIILTGQGTKDVVIDALRGMADDYLEKPIDPEKLKSTVQKLLKSGKNAKNKIELAKRFIQTNYDKKISLKDVSEELCLSPKYFSRLFKEKVGQGFDEYRLRVKAEAVKSVLKKSSVAMSRIAQDFGYQDLKSFTRFFRKYAGCTPHEYKCRTLK